MTEVLAWVRGDPMRLGLDDRQVKVVLGRIASSLHQLPALDG
jgi:hypothetical protein